MASTNGHGPTNRAILYARVSTADQIKGYSLRQQIEALREYAAREGFTVQEEITEPGHSAESLVRPGMDRVRDLVAAGGVAVVLAQDADRITRDPAHRAFLDDEMAQFGTRLIALDDWGDDTHEGELLKYMKGWVSKGERLKIAERTRRGKLRKAKEGKVIAGRAASYGRAAFGFKYNESRDGQVLDEERILVVKRMFYMAGVEGSLIYAIKRSLDAEGVSTPTGKSGWAPQLIRRYLLSDLYKPSNAGRREWELSGGILRCAECGRAMTAHTCPKPERGRVYFYYRCSAGAYKWGGRGTACEAVKHHRAEELEERVWGVISGLLKEPERLRAGLDVMIEQEKAAHGDPEAETALWLDKLSEVNRKRARYQEMAAEDLIGFDELRARIAELEETRAVAERELRSLKHRQEQMHQLERDKETLLDDYAGMLPEALDALDAPERHRVYKMLRVDALIAADGSLEVSGDVMSVCEMETSST